MISTVNNILLEVENQLPNCLDNSKGIYSISFKQLVKEGPLSNIIEYV